MAKCGTCKEELSKQREKPHHHKGEVVGWTIYWICKNHHLTTEFKKKN